MQGWPCRIWLISLSMKIFSSTHFLETTSFLFSCLKHSPLYRCTQLPLEGFTMELTSCHSSTINLTLSPCTRNRSAHVSSGTDGESQSPEVPKVRVAVAMETRWLPQHLNFTSSFQPSLRWRNQELLRR